MMGGTPEPAGSGGADAMLRIMENLSRSHHEHEKYYASAPREQAVQLQRASRTLLALADHWMSRAPSRGPGVSPYEGADDLTSPVARQLSGVLFLEGEGEPAEIARLKQELRALADQALSGGAWLAAAMEASWETAGATVDLPGLADLLGERHRIISNNWRAATMSTLIGRVLHRALEILDRVDFSPGALRADLAGDAVAPQRLYSAAELIDHAADLSSDSAGLTHDNERRWRVFHARVEHLLAAEAAGARA